MSKRKILVIVEGEKTDFNLMQRILKLYGISEEHNIISYNTNIYALYNQLPENYEEYDDFDLLQLLKETETNEEKRAILSERYSDILLIFDLDPQDPSFTPAKIRCMANYFTESTNMGRLYLNYPMVESFYHMDSIPDNKYNNYTVALEVLKDKKFKQNVHDLCRDGDYRKFASTKRECNIVIKQNLIKSKSLINDETKDFPDLISVLENQLKLLKDKGIISVLCTCILYIAEYNSNLICDD